MSYSTNRRDALDTALPLPYRASHARSLAMLIGHKYRVPRAEVFDIVQRVCGVDLAAPIDEVGVAAAVQVLDRIKAGGLGAADTPDAEACSAAGGETDE